MIAATNRAILLLHIGRRGATEPLHMAMRHSRHHHFGAPRRRASYVLRPSVMLGSATLVVPSRFSKDVAAADAALDAMGR